MTSLPWRCTTKRITLACAPSTYLQLTHSYVTISFVRTHLTEVSEIETKIEAQRARIKTLKSGKRWRKDSVAQANQYLQELLEQKARLTSEDDWNYISITVYWEDYLSELQGTTSTIEEFVAKKDDYGGVHSLLKEINESNKVIVEEALQSILSKATLTHTNNEVNIRLRSDTFNNYYSRQDFQTWCTDIRKQYPFVELFHSHDNVCVIRVWWKMYYLPAPVLETKDALSGPSRFSRFTGGFPGGGGYTLLR